MWAWLLTLMNRHGSERGWGWEFIIRKFFTQFKKNAVYQNRIKNIEIKKKIITVLTNIYIYMYNIRTCNTCFLNILIDV